MKFSLNLILLIVAFLFVIFFSAGLGCSSVSPYSRSSSQLHEFPYESFGNQVNEYTTASNNASIDSYSTNNITPAAVNGGVKVTGFDGLLSSPTEQGDNIDTYIKSTGDKTCKSYGYSNSMGNLCLNDEQIRLLTTRGGNMSSGEAIIG